MSKLTDIKYRIDQLDGGAFQNLCDVYLSCRGYGAVYSLGMNTGTDKTAKGNPDTYFLTANNKYAFVMYTTQKTDFLKKVIEDIDKCFDSSKTGVAPDDVDEIIYCHTFGRLLPGDHQSLLNHCKAHNSVLTLIGLDELATDLYLKYPRLAKDFLGISVDTGQITSINEFIQNHNSNKLAAPLDTTFLFRESEIQVAREKLDRNNILLISGPAGTGKTRLSLHLCELISKEAGYEVLCIRNKNLELYEDLMTSLEAGKDYLVFVDDANELSGLRHVLGYLLQEGNNVAHIRKLILSVRDYARDQVVQQVLETSQRLEILKLGSFSDTNIKELVKQSYGITNPHYLERISDISEGNARLAMLAGKVASNANTLDSIRDASGLYENYYGRQIEAIANSKSGITSAGIMAFFQRVSLEKLEYYTSIFDSVGLTETQFIEDLKCLHGKELVDLCQNKAARISDQSFSNYLLKYVFVDQKVIPLSKMIEIGFFLNKEQTIEACNILLNVFSEDTLQQYVEEQINAVWSDLENNTEKFLPFFKSFHMVRPTDTLLLLKKWVEEDEGREYDVSLVNFKKDNNDANIDDDIIHILCSFSDHEQLSEAVELLFLYYQKRPDLAKQVYTACTDKLGVNRYSYMRGYYSQQIVVDRLCGLIDRSPSAANLKLFIAIAGAYLKFCFHSSKGGRRNILTLYTTPLEKTDVVVQYRQKLIAHLLSIYQSGQFQQEIEDLLYHYCRDDGYGINYEIVKCDFAQILKFTKLFIPENIYHCAIAKHLLEVSDKIGDGYQELLRPLLESPKFLIYELLKDNIYDMHGLSHNERIDIHKKRVQSLADRYSISDFRSLFGICLEALQTIDKEGRQLSAGIEYAIDSIPTDNQELYVAVIEEYLKINTPYNISPEKILCRLFEMMSPEDVKTLIARHDFSQKNSWLWAFYTELPENLITSEWANDLLAYLSSPPSDLVRSSLRPIDQIQKYEVVRKNIILSASEVICEHYDDSPFVFSLYFRLMFNPYHRDDIDLLPSFKGRVKLLEDIYLKYITYSPNDDYNGQILALIIQWDQSFLYRYLDEYVSQSERLYYSKAEWAKRLRLLWEDSQYFEHVSNVSAHLAKRLSETPWLYSATMKQLLRSSREDNDELSQRQDLWISHTIQRHSNDKKLMCALFSSIEECSQERRKQALAVLLKVNSDFSVFEKLPLEPAHWGGTGSLIPHMQARITYLSSLLPMLSGLEYLQHKQRVLHEIELWEYRIKREEVQELLES